MELTPSATTGSAPPRRVAVAHCPTYTPGSIATALTEALNALGGISAFVKPGQTILLKPNLFSPHAPDDAVTTHPELVRQMILSCARAGAARIWVGDSPVGQHDEAELWKRTGMTDAVAGTPAVLKSWRVPQRPLSCGPDILSVPEWFAQVDVVISLAKLKTHSLTTMTGALKNVYGIVTGPAKTQFHVQYPSPLAMSNFLVRVFATLKPALTLVDAVVAMEGNGPAHGHPRPVGVLMASRDAIALDAVGCQALRISPSSVPMIRIAASQGLGCADPAMIECVGSGLPCLQAARLKPSLARYLRLLPEWSFRLTPLLFRMRPWIRRQSCIRCGMCITTCPRKAIREETATGYPKVSLPDCIGCFCCLESCPQGAFALRVYLANRICVAHQRYRRPANP